MPSRYQPSYTNATNLCQKKSTHNLCPAPLKSHLVFFYSHKKHFSKGLYQRLNLGIWNGRLNTTNSKYEITGLGRMGKNFVRLRCSELTHKFPPRPSEWTPWSWTRWGECSLLPMTTRAGPWTTSQRTTSPWTAPPWTTLVPLHGFSTWEISSWTHPNWSVAIWRWNKNTKIYKNKVQYSNWNQEIGYKWLIVLFSIYHRNLFDFLSFLYD